MGRFCSFLVALRLIGEVEVRNSLPVHGKCGFDSVDVECIQTLYVLHEEM
jgi:hypothetical protein